MRAGKSVKTLLVDNKSLLFHLRLYRLQTQVRQVPGHITSKYQKWVDKHRELFGTVHPPKQFKLLRNDSNSFK